MKIIKKGIAALCIVPMLCTGAYAEKIPYSCTGDYANNTITISGTVNGGNFVVLQMLKEGYTYDDLAKDRTSSDLIMYRDQIDTADGKFSFVIQYPDNSETGYYNVRIVSDGENEATDIIVPVVTKGAYKEAVKEINDVVKDGAYEDFAKKIKELELPLGLNLELMESLEDENALAKYFEYVKKNPLKDTEAEMNDRIFNTYILVEALETEKTENIDNYIENTIIGGTELYSDYKSGAKKEAEQKYITNKLSGRSYNDADEFETAFTQAYIFEEIRYATGYEGVKNVLTKYGDAVGIKSTAPKDVYKQMSGKEYDGESIADDYSRLKKKYESQSSSGGGGGSSSGGGFSGGVNGDKNTYMNGEYQGDTKTEAPHSISVYFNDIDGVEWAAEAILALADRNIINGKSEGYFVPDDFVTREEFAKILVGAMGYTDTEYSENVFSDVDAEDWFCDFVNIAYEKKLIKGIGDGLFGTGQFITRQDMCVMLCNALRSKGVAVSDSEIAFADKDEIADYAKSAVSALYEMGIVNGVSETEFEPLGNATRAQAAKVVYGALKQLQ